MRESLRLVLLAAAGAAAMGAAWSAHLLRNPLLGWYDFFHGTGIPGGFIPLTAIALLLPRYVTWPTRQTAVEDAGVELCAWHIISVPVTAYIVDVTPEFRGIALSCYTVCALAQYGINLLSIR